MAGKYIPAPYEYCPESPARSGVRNRGKALRSAARQTVLQAVRIGRGNSSPYRGTTTTPHGDRPTATFVSTVIVFVSTTETSLEGPLAV